MKTCLIVDDEMIMLRALQQHIVWKDYGIEKILTATSMQQAQKIFKELEVDLLLCDIEMPDGNGLELFEWVKSYFPYVECIYITCHPDFKYIQKALRLGSFDYILKPIDYSELDIIIRRVLPQIDKNLLIKEHIHKKARQVLSNGREIIENNSDMIEQIKKYVKNHLSEDIAMVNLADVIHLNAQHMVRVFKNHEGISILEYITHERIDVAKKLLVETNYSIYQIADTVGYSNYSYFTKVFKKLEKMTPQEYRKNLK